VPDVDVADAAMLFETVPVLRMLGTFVDAPELELLLPAFA